MLDFHEKMARCYLCEQTWFKDTFRWDLWYADFNRLVREGKCSYKPEGLTIFEKIVPPQIFYPCLHEVIKEEKCQLCRNNLLFSTEPYILDRRILVMKEKVRYKRIENGSTEGVQMLKDMRYLMAEFSLGRSIELDYRLYDFEIFISFWSQFAIPILFSFTAVVIVILIITSDLTATLVVTLSVVLTNLFLSGMIHYWNLSMNPIVILQIILGIGCSVDFSAHIAFAFLVEDVSALLPPKASKSDIRKKKAELALGKMGSSVFHGGFSTFLALSVLAPANTYIFLVFYRMWFGIILFGLANGFLLLPVILSFVGTTETAMDHIGQDDQTEE